MRRRARWVWGEAAWLVWGGLTLGLAVQGFLYPWSHTVYPIYAAAARNWWAGHDLYVRTFEYYRYSPLFAVLITPFAVLPDSWGNGLWKAGSCLVYAAGLGAWARHVLPVRLRGGALAGLFLLVLPLSLHSMYNGQANLVMLGCTLGGLATAATGRWNRAAGFLAVATLIKGYPLALALVLMGLYPTRFALRFLAALGLGLLLPFATQWPSVVAAQYQGWFDHLWASTEIMRERLRSLDHLLAVLNRPLPPAQFAVLGLMAGVGVFGMCCLQARQTLDRRELLTRVCLLYVTWVALFGPATESCTYVVMAPAAAWALVDAFRRPAWPVTRLLLAASLLLMGPLVTDLFGAALRDFAIAHGSQPIGALLFLAHLLARTGRPYRQTPMSEPTHLLPAAKPAA